MSNDMIEICRSEYDHLRKINEEYSRMIPELMEVKADRDHISQELAKMSELFSQKYYKCEEQEKELLHLRGFAEAVKILGGVKKLYE